MFQWMKKKIVNIKNISSSSMTINGTKVCGNNVRIIVDDKEVDVGKPIESIHIEVHGDCGDIQTMGSVKVDGNARDIEAQGRVEVGNDAKDIESQGRVEVGGNCQDVEAMGSVTVKGSSGSVQAMGSVRVGSTR